MIGKLRTFLIFSIIVPVVMLGVVEGLAWVILRILPEDAQTIAMSMPQWMLEGRERKAQVKTLQEDWFSLFESGPGFRARLVPDSSGTMNNAFALAPQDRTERYEVKANSLGFRSAELPSKKAPHVYRILIFGDSSSFGWGVEQDQRYDELLRKYLEPGLPRGTQVEVGNFAIPGDSSEFGALIFNNFASRYDPDLVILSFGANDAKYVRFPHKGQVERFTNHSVLHQLVQPLKTTSLGTLFTRALAGITPKGPQASSTTNGQRKQRAVPLKRYRENLITMANKARAHGATVAFLSICSPRDYSRAMKKVAKSLNARFLNGQVLLNKSLPLLKAEEIYPENVEALKQRYKTLLQRQELLYVTSDGCHPNNLGHQLLAEKLAELIGSTRTESPSES